MELDSIAAEAREVAGIQDTDDSIEYQESIIEEEEHNEEPATSSSREDYWAAFAHMGAASELLLKSILADPSQHSLGATVDLAFMEGQRYVGQMLNGQLQGEGHYFWPDGLAFQGAFDRSRVHRQGTIAWPDGAQYTGQVESGRRHGVGSMTFGEQQLKYTGDWSNGLRHGKGKLIYSPSCWYTGDWSNDQREGEGTFCFPSGSVYRGQWRADKRHGRGTMVWLKKEQQSRATAPPGAPCIVSPPPNVIYRGEWQDGLPHGSGEQLWLPAGEVIDPVWLRGEGPLELHVPPLLCNRYVGQMERGRRTGEGIFYYASGAQFKGRWSEDLKDGPGQFVSESGVAQEATFAADRQLSESPEKARPATAEPEHVTVHVDDLLWCEDDPEKSGRALGHVLLRNTSELRAIYTKYSRMGASGGDAAVMTVHQLGMLLKDARLLSPELPLARVHRLVAALFGLASEESALLFREFVETVVRVACLQTNEAVSLEAKVQRAIMTQLLPLASLRPTAGERVGTFLGSTAGSSFMRARADMLRSLLGRSKDYDDGICTAEEVLALIQACWGALRAPDAALGLLEVLGVLDDSTGDDPFAAFLMDTHVTLSEAWAAIFHHVDKLGGGAGTISALADKVDAGLRGEIERRTAPLPKDSPTNEESRLEEEDPLTDAAAVRGDVV